MTISLHLIYLHKFLKMSSSLRDCRASFDLVLLLANLIFLLLFLLFFQTAGLLPSMTFKQQTVANAPCPCEQFAQEREKCTERDACWLKYCALYFLNGSFSKHSDDAVPLVIFWYGAVVLKLQGAGLLCCTCTIYNHYKTKKL